MASGSGDKVGKRSAIGGLAFYSSLVCLILIATLSISIIPQLWTEEALTRVGYFILGFIPGLFLAMYVLAGKYNVLVHEFKHWLVSGLVGNRFKSLKVGEQSGHFSYSYSRRTAAYNAFIAVAPYCIPLFTFVFLLVSLAGWRHDRNTVALLIGIGYGADIVMNLRDISPRQTDLTYIRGGFWVGLTYVAAANLSFSSLLLAWILQGWNGLKLVLIALWQIVTYFIIHGLYA